MQKHKFTKEFIAGCKDSISVSLEFHYITQEDAEIFRDALDEIALLTTRVKELEESDKYDTKLTKKRIEEEATMWLGCVEKLQAKIKELEDANRWIPVGERDPKDYGFYQVVMKDGTQTQKISRATIYYSKDTGWERFFSIVTHWRENLPLPTLPEVEE